MGLIGTRRALGFGAIGGVRATTWNPADKAPNIALSNGNLTADGTAMAANDRNSLRATNYKSAGKWYFEITWVSADSGQINPGLGTAALNLLTGYSGASDGGIGWPTGNSVIRANTNTSNASVGVTPSVGDIFGIVVDLDVRLATISKNGTFYNGSDPNTGTAGMQTIQSSVPMVPCGGFDRFGSGSPSFVLNCGATAFANTPPTGYTAWG